MAKNRGKQKIVLPESTALSHRAVKLIEMLWDFQGWTAGKGRNGEKVK